MLLLRDFGIKDKVRSVKSLYGVPGMEPEDEQKFREIVEKYEMKATIIILSHKDRQLLQDCKRHEILWAVHG